MGSTDGHVAALSPTTITMATRAAGAINLAHSKVDAAMARCTPADVCTGRPQSKGGARVAGGCASLRTTPVMEGLKP